MCNSSPTVLDIFFQNYVTKFLIFNLSHSFPIKKMIVLISQLHDRLTQPPSHHPWGPPTKIHPTTIPRTGLCQDLEENSGRVRRGHRGDGGTHNGRTPQGLTGTWAQAEGGKGGGAHSQERWQTQAHSTGRRDERRGLAGGRRGRCPGGRSFSLGE